MVPTIYSYQYLIATTHVGNYFFAKVKTRAMHLIIGLAQKVPGRSVITAMHCLASLKFFPALLSHMHFAFVYFFKECPTFINNFGSCTEYTSQVGSRYQLTIWHSYTWQIRQLWRGQHFRRRSRELLDPDHFIRIQGQFRIRNTGPEDFGSRVRARRPDQAVGDDHRRDADVPESAGDDWSDRTDQEEVQTWHSGWTISLILFVVYHLSTFYFVDLRFDKVAELYKNQSPLCRLFKLNKFTKFDQTSQFWPPMELKIPYRSPIK